MTWMPTCRLPANSALDRFSTRALRALSEFFRLEAAGGLVLAEAMHGVLAFAGSYAPPKRAGKYKGGGVGPSPCSSYSACVVEVNVDRETGEVTPAEVWIAHDVGRAVNPLILHGQTHGGIAAGVGQALMELCAYDADGQYLSASFMDYALPRADLFPRFVTEISEVPSTTNPLGLRGGGEGGTTPALGALTNAIVDALAEFGVEHIEMPATPERVWRAIRTARG